MNAEYDGRPGINSVVEKLRAEIVQLRTENAELRAIMAKSPDPHEVEHMRKRMYQSSKPEPQLIYVREDQWKEAHAEIERLQTAYELGMEGYYVIQAENLQRAAEIERLTAEVTEDHVLLTASADEIERLRAERKELIANHVEYESRIIEVMAENIRLRGGTAAVLATGGKVKDGSR